MFSATATGSFLTFVALLSSVTLAVAAGPPNAGGYAKRGLCSGNLVACQVYGRPDSFWSCVDIKKDLHSCGGCVIKSLHPEYCQDVGQDCSSIPYASDVSCDGGKCHVHHCQGGFKPGPGGSSCVYDDKHDHDDDKDKDDKDNDDKDKDDKHKDDKHKNDKDKDDKDKDDKDKDDKDKDGKDKDDHDKDHYRK